MKATTFELKQRGILRITNPRGRTIKKSRIELMTKFNNNVDIKEFE